MYYIYILTNESNKTLYIGVTNNLKRRLYEHIEEYNNGFTKKYAIHKLVYYEEYGDAYTAITREKQLKRWRREKKVLLIEKKNPSWRDLRELMV